MVSETVQFLKKDTFYIRLALTYSPEIIAKRVVAKGDVLDSVGYINEFNSLNSLRAYYYYQLQNRYNLHPAAIENHVKKEHPSFFSVKIENITVPRSAIHYECPPGLFLILICCIATGRKMWGAAAPVIFLILKQGCMNPVWMKTVNHPVPTALVLRKLQRSLTVQRIIFIKH